MALIPKLPYQPYVPAPGYVGEPTRDPITTNLWRVGQVSHHAVQRWKQAHGRYLAGMEGFGSMNGLGAMTNMEEPFDPKFNSDGVSDLEKMDDVSGSGIFDAAGQGANLHREYGVFEDHASVPGYVQRENLFRVSKEVKAVNDADVVIVPSGGMTFREQNGVPINYDARDLPSPCWPDAFSKVACRGGPSPLHPFVPPMEATAPATQVLAPPEIIVVEPPAPVRPMFPRTPGMGVRPGVRGEPRRPTMPLRAAKTESPSRGTPMLAAPSSTTPTPVRVSTEGRAGRPAPVHLRLLGQEQPRRAVLGVAQKNPELRAPAYQAGPPEAPKDRGVPFQAQSRGLLRMNTQDVGVPLRPVRASRALGAEDDAPGVGTYIFFGALIGGAIAMLKGASSIKVK